MYVRKGEQSQTENGRELDENGRELDEKNGGTIGLNISLR
jgi:hypothetical protein